MTKLAEGHILKELFPIPDELNQALDDEQEAVVETIAVLVKTYQA